jgi:Archaeal/vacuolar-type H+-ATPase subunit F
MYKKMAIMGGKNSIIPFKGIGIDVFPVQNIADAKVTLEKIAVEYGVIFITERVAEQLIEVISKYNHEIIPAIIPIPSSTGSVGIGMHWIEENVEKALGQNIL